MTEGKTVHTNAANKVIAVTIRVLSIDLHIRRTIWRSIAKQPVQLGGQRKYRHSVARWSDRTDVLAFDGTRSLRRTLRVKFRPKFIGEINEFGVSKLPTKKLLIRSSPCANEQIGSSKAHREMRGKSSSLHPFAFSGFCRSHPQWLANIPPPTVIAVAQRKPCILCGLLLRTTVYLQIRIESRYHFQQAEHHCPSLTTSLLQGMHSSIVHEQSDFFRRTAPILKLNAKSVRYSIPFRQ